MTRRSPPAAQCHQFGGDGLEAAGADQHGRQIEPDRDGEADRSRGKHGARRIGSLTWSNVVQRPLPSPAAIRSWRRSKARHGSASDRNT